MDNAKYKADRGTAMNSTDYAAYTLLPLHIQSLKCKNAVEVL